jgi:hypothetical protein
MSHVLVHVLEFDDGDVSAQKLGEGTRAECDRIAGLLPAVAYNGDKKVKDSWLAVVTAEEWQTALDEERAMEASHA